MEKLTPQQLNFEAFKCELRVMPFSDIADYRTVLADAKADNHSRNFAAVSLYRDKSVDRAKRVNEAMGVWAKVDDAEANFLLSTAYFQHNKKEEGIDRLRKAIKLGSVPAQLRAGYCTLMGIGVKPDLEKAAKIFKRLATEKVPEAVYFTGALYMMGSETTPQDPEKARKLLMWSVKNGCKFAEFEHGITLLANPETKDEAIDYIYRAAAKQEIRAMMWLAIELARGTILEKNLAASQNYMEQCYALHFKPAVDAVNEALKSDKK
mgnify:FL=1